MYFVILINQWVIPIAQAKSHRIIALDPSHSGSSLLEFHLFSLPFSLPILNSEELEGITFYSSYRYLGLNTGTVTYYLCDLELFA